MAIWTHACIMNYSFYTAFRGRFLFQPFHLSFHLFSAVVPGQPRQSLPVQLSVSIPLKIITTHLFTLAVFRKKNCSASWSQTGDKCCDMLVNAYCPTQLCCFLKPWCCDLGHSYYQWNWVWKLGYLNLCNVVWCPISTRCVSGCEAVTHSEHTIYYMQLSSYSHL